ncbi:MAG: hypothetical protein IH594_00335 [Bacteroidales bacterium]|nr:hypothetical protein [Bacteroidales bacterium]
MNNKFIILYRYHKDFELVRERVKLIKAIDPEVKVFGIFGGAFDKYDEATRFLQEYFEDNYLVKVESGKWKWLHADIIYQRWFEDMGRHIDFEFAAVLEWDLLYMEKIGNLFPGVKEDELRVSGIIPREEVSQFWYWSKPENISKYRAFKTQVENYYHISLKDYAMLGPGLCMPRAFLEALSKIKLFEAEVSDELKIPVWAQVLGFRLTSNNFYRTWFSFFEQHYFNANIVDVSLPTIKKEIMKPKGRRAFHPFRENAKAEELKLLYTRSIEKNGHYINDTKYPVSSIKPYLYKLYCKLTDIKFGKPKMDEAIK